MLKPKKNFYFDFDNIHFTNVLHKQPQPILFSLFIIISIGAGLMIGWFLHKTFQTPAHKKLTEQIQYYHLKYSIIQQEVHKLSQSVQFLEEIDNNTYRTIYELPIVPPDMRLAGIGGAPVQQEPFSKNVEIAFQLQNNLDFLIRRMEIQAKSFQELKFFAVSKERLLASLPIIMPVDKNKIRITSLFGWRKNPFNSRVISFHSGVDFAGDVGTPIYATGDGIVSAETGYRQGYGLTVVIDHGFGYQTIYAHLSKILVSPGQKVKRGQIVGKLGSSGSTTGPHLHYEVVRNGQKVNPMHFIMQTLTTQEYNAIIDLQN